ncbi:hypothetical protein QJS04_geneDACA018091 [Acorus gramineus]|uniref:Uncharacterized protein n=1 Tax=Acorus gramineus TaxID=55184 RepID=A0AAV9A7R1_ACOGR|nr:hypothetical protein QJS04_geneDACA018091 [Acorus gramineus]
MEDSTTQSSMNKSFPSKETTASSSSEESGWTKYFEDFISSSQTQNMSIEGSSLVSDAASGVIVASKTPATTFKKLSFKKRRRRGGGSGVDEDPLEDTASSPVNSPKVGGLNQLDENPRKKDDTIEKTKEGEIGPGDPVEVHGNETEEMVFVGNECSELKKRGLCLVPLSMLVNYVG